MQVRQSVIEQRNGFPIIAADLWRTVLCTNVYANALEGLSSSCEAAEGYQNKRQRVTL